MKLQDSLPCLKKQAIWSYREPFNSNHVLSHLIYSSNVPLRRQGSLLKWTTLYFKRGLLASPSVILVLFVFT